MTTARQRRQEYLNEFEFTDLFIEEQGWNYLDSDAASVNVDGFDYALTPVAEKSGFAVFRCSPDADGSIPTTPVRRKIDAQLAKTAYEHIIIFADAHQTSQTWQWVKREDGKSALRQRSFRKGQSGEAILQALERIEFALEDEAELGEVASRVKRALDVEKVTKSFYDRFRREMTAFHDFIEGITEQGDSQWYASLMLNRMMFIYFIQKRGQKRGFLDGDPDYLRNRLSMVRAQTGDGNFQQFYRAFLRRLFHEGLGQPESERSPDLAMLLGKVPFLNGGLFDVHDLERDNDEISIPDEAFERVFDFFDAYQWHLDDRPNKDDNEINPDVIGYIFEKYINQKQMGAYYTKEDITGYISRNTVIPYLFDAAKKDCRTAFTPGGGVWRLLSEDPDRYIYPAVGHGMAYRYSAEYDSEPIPNPLELPDEIAAGISDVSKRGGWNAPAPDDYALPTETWREVVARRRRYSEVRAKLAAGDVQDVNDLITLNLDIERFALDVITQSEGPELLRAFWRALTGVSVLDPTCGSGAFLFAALNILEPLYTACLEGMRGFLDDLERSERPRSPEALSDFRKVLAQVQKHPSERYFILKSIVLDNLYGVDIMEEAVEICKLRLFLKLVAQLETYDQIEPLPDIDFNIRAGNTLVGFTSLDAVRRAMTVTPTGQARQLFPEDEAKLTRIEEDAEIASRAFDQFRQQQTALGGEITPGDKATLRARFRTLSDELDRHLATEYGIDPDDTAAYNAWRATHQPFHWFVEFYGIMANGGFDVIIGNPPYVEYSKVKRDYTIKDYQTESCGNLYAYTMERSVALMKQNGWFSFIIPISLTAAQRMATLQDYLFDHSSIMWLSNYALRPAALFPGVMQRNTICIMQKGSNAVGYTTDYLTWYSAERSFLFNNIHYQLIGESRQDYCIPKINNPWGRSSLLKMLSLGSPWQSYRQFKGDHIIHYHNAGGYWIKTFNFVPYYRSFVNPNKRHTTISSLRMPTQELATLYCGVLNSSLFYFFWKSLTDARHLYPSDIAMFPINLRQSNDISNAISTLVYELMIRLKENSKRITYGKSEVDQYNVSPAKPIIDQIDKLLADHYGFTDEELDFIINYDIKYRMGKGEVNV